jgi:hypothetical protein
VQDGIINSLKHDTELADNSVDVSLSKEVMMIRGWRERWLEKRISITKEIALNALISSHHHTLETFRTQPLL